MLILHALKAEAVLILLAEMWSSEYMSGWNQVQVEHPWSKDQEGFEQGTNLFCASKFYIYNMSGLLSEASFTSKNDHHLTSLMF